MPSLVDASGKPVQVDDSNLTQALLSGQVGTAAPTVLVLAAGKVYSVPTESLPKFNADVGGVHVLTDAEVAQHEAEKQQAALQAKAGGLGGQIATAPVAALSGLTGGLSDAAIAAISPDARQWVAEHYAANPITKVASQVVGAAAPVLLSGGAAAPEEAAGLLGEGAEAAGGLAEGAEALSPTLASRASSVVQSAGAIPRAIDAAGQMVEHGFGTILGDNAPSLLARTAQRAIAKGAGGALEGALYGVGDQISEDALGDHELTGQQLLAAAGHGALFGGLLGVGGTVASEVASAGLGALTRSPKLSELAETQAWRSLNPAKAFTKEAGKYVDGGFRSIGRQLLDDGVIAPGDTVEEIAGKVHDAKLSAINNQSRLLSELEARGANGVDAVELSDNVKANLPDLVKKLGDKSPEYRAVQSHLDQLQALADADGKVTLSDLSAYRKRLDDDINYQQSLSFKGTDSPTNAALKNMRATLENQFMKQADSEASRLGGSDAGSWAKDWKDAKGVTQKYIIADRAAQQAVGGMYSNQALSLTDKMFAAHGMEAGAITHAMKHMAGGALAGGVLGGANGDHDPASMLRDMAAGAAMGLVSKTIRERGNATLATFLDKAKDLGAVRQVINRVDSRMSSQATKAVHGEPVRAKSVDPAAYESVVKRVRAAANDTTHEEAVQSHLGTIAANAPKVAAAFGSAAKRATMYLAGKVPPERVAGPMAKAQPTPLSEKMGLLYANRAIEDPAVLLRDVRSGTLRKDTVDAVKTVYPALYDQMRSQVIDAIGKKGADLPYARKLQLSKFLDIDPDGTLAQPFVATMQSGYGPSPAKPPATPHATKANLKGMDNGMGLAARTPLKS